MAQLLSAGRGSRARTLAASLASLLQRRGAGGASRAAPMSGTGPGCQAPLADGRSASAAASERAGGSSPAAGSRAKRQRLAAPPAAVENDGSTAGQQGGRQAASTGSLRGGGSGGGKGGGSGKSAGSSRETTGSRQSASGNSSGARPSRGGSAAYVEPAPGTVSLPGGAQLTYSTDFLPAAEAEALFRTLHAELTWEQRSVRVMGRVVPQPRLVAYQADGPELSYTYSGATMTASPWHPAISALKARVEQAAGERFNCCLLNLYRSGADALGWHSDSERLFGARPTIASVSLGAPREFLLRSNADKSCKVRLRLGGGALLVMGPGVQEGWMHSVPRRAGSAAAGERISLTFRRIVAPEGGGGG